jgi:hypothetical protein
MPVPTDCLFINGVVLEGKVPWRVVGEVKQFHEPHGPELYMGYPHHL